MDRYRALREKVEEVSKQIIGKTFDDALALCKENQLPCRTVMKDGRGMMITADCKMDRIGFVLENGVVTSTMNG